MPKDKSKPMPGQKSPPCSPPKTTPQRDGLAKAAKEMAKKII